MVIAGIRSKIRSDIDTHRSVSFTKYLMHYLRMFTILGIIVPILVGVDYYMEPLVKEETLENKFYKVVDNLDNTEYNFYTESHHFIAKARFYENIEIGDPLKYYYTPIFGTLTDISYQKGGNMYVSHPVNIYNWPLIPMVLTFICSAIFILRTWRNKFLRNEFIINLGIVNAFLCVFTLVVVLSQIAY